MGSRIGNWLVWLYTVYAIGDGVAMLSNLQVYVSSTRTIAMRFGRMDEAREDLALRIVWCGVILAVAVLLHVIRMELHARKSARLLEEIVNRRKGG